LSASTRDYLPKEVRWMGDLTLIILRRRSMVHLQLAETTDSGTLQRTPRLLSTSAASTPRILIVHAGNGSRDANLTIHYRTQHALKCASTPSSFSHKSWSSARLTSVAKICDAVSTPNTAAIPAFPPSAEIVDDRLAPRFRVNIGVSDWTDTILEG
jgi:hypothetical protein